MQLQITSTNTRLTDALKSQVERRLRFAITRFTPTVGDVSVALSDESGPKGAPTKKCQIAVRLRPKGLVIVEAKDGTFDAAVGIAADRVSRSLARHLERRRLGRKRQRRNETRQRNAELTGN